MERIKIGSTQEYQVRGFKVALEACYVRGAFQGNAKKCGH